MRLDDPQERAGIAGEYVLGTLGDVERLEVEALLLSDRALRAEVAAWQDRLLGLAKHAAPVDPQPSLWLRIDAALAAMPRSAAGTVAAPAADAHVASVRPAGAPVGAGDAANDASFWRKTGFWQALSGLAVAACLVLATLLVTGQNRFDAPHDRYVAVLQSPDRTAGWIVETSPTEPLKLRPLVAGGVVPEGKSLQFWTKIDGASGPTSLGIVKAGEPLEVAVSKLPGVVGNQLFEITLEPPNGSPIDRPTGPILFIGRSVKV